MTGQDLINSSLRLINVLGSGEAPSTNESSDALATLNAMIDSWNAQSLAIFCVEPQTYNLTSGQQVYAFGPGGDFDAPRPARIERCSIITCIGTDLPLELPIAYLTTGQWQHVPTKSVPSLLPMEVWDDQAWPSRNLSFWPIPNMTNVQTRLYCWQALSQFANLTTDYTFPPGYEKAIRYNLAVDLAPEYGVMQVNPLVVATAQTSLGVVKAMNSTRALEPLRCDPASRGATGKGIYDWRTGQILGRY